MQQTLWRINIAGERGARVFLNYEAKIEPYNAIKTLWEKNIYFIYDQNIYYYRLNYNNLYNFKDQLF